MTLGGPVKNGRVNRGWRAAVFAQAETVRLELVLAASERGLTVNLAGTPSVSGGTATDATIARMVLECVRDAVGYASQSSTPWRWLSGSHNEGAWTRLHSADELLVELMSPTRLASFAPQVAETCRRALPPSDPQRAAVERIVRAVSKNPPAKLGDTARGVMRDALHAAYARNEKRYQKARALRNKTIAIAAFLLALTLAAIVTGAWRPKAIPVCLQGEPAGSQVCPTGRSTPTGGDVALVAAVGAVAAAISAARALMGTSRRVGVYSAVAAQGALKIVLGALLAIVGLTLLRAGWVPGVDDVDTGAEIVAWALLFGYAQQVLTGLLDQRAEAALAPPDPQDAEPVPVPAVEEEIQDEPPPGGEPSGGEMSEGQAEGEPSEGQAEGEPSEGEAEGEPSEGEISEDDGAGADEGDGPPEETITPVVAAPRKRARSAASGGSARPSARPRGSARGG